MIDIDPNGTGLPGIEQLRIIVGAVMTVGLILSVLALIVSAIVWGFGANSSNPHLASRGKVGVLVSCGAAIIWAISQASGNYHVASKSRVGVLVALGAAALAGGAVALMNWLISIGQTL